MTIKAPALTLAIALVAGLPSNAAAQTPPPAATAADRADARWAPWFGCWQMLEESRDDGAAAIARLLGVPPPQTTRGSNALVCVTAADRAGATMTTLVSNRPVLTETIIPDGSQRTVTEQGCRGWQRAEWSPLGARVYAAAEISCEGQPTRKVSGMAILMAGPTWIDIQMIESDGMKSVRVRRYQRAADQKAAGPMPALTGTPMPLNVRFSIADVKEASRKVPPEALQAALVELKHGFDLNGKALVDLDKSGIDTSVIDLMVALSFPERFAVDRTATYAGGGGSGWWSGMGYDDLWPYMAEPYYMSPIYSVYYAPFGYNYWGYYNPYYYGGPGYVVTDPGSGGSTPEPSGNGRVVDGHGYTRIRRTDPGPAVPRVGSSGHDASTASTAGQSGSGSSGSSGNGGVSSSGYSGGGGGGRTAQPRPPGGSR